MAGHLKCTASAWPSVIQQAIGLKQVGIAAEATLPPEGTAATAARKVSAFCLKFASLSFTAVICTSPTFGFTAARGADCAP